MSHTEYTSLSGSDLVRRLSQRTDREIISLFEARFGRHKPAWALIALGGYARLDLCPYSDLDLLLLIENRTSKIEIESVVGEMLYPLWDKGFNASYSVRTIKETLKDAKRDFFFRTSLIDMRFICGSDLPFKELNKVLEKNRALNNTGKFMSDLLFHTRMRQEKYGDVSYILEPDLKDGHGGLRDYHTVAWATCILSHGGFPVSDILPLNERRRLDDAYDFLLKTRFILHELSGRKNDRMYLEYQEELAENLGFEEGNAESAVEAFMRHFYKMALTIRSLGDDFMLSLSHMLGLAKSPPNRLLDSHFQVFSGQLAFRNSKVLESRPHLIMHVFELISQKDYTLSPSARSDIRDLLVKGCDLRHNTLAHEAFFRVLLSPDPGRALTSMLELGIFECFIPEFETIKGRTIFDLYHTYTVDIHSINTVTELKRLEQNEATCSKQRGINKPSLSLPPHLSPLPLKGRGNNVSPQQAAENLLIEPGIFSRIQDKKALYLSTLLHDIGKGYGRDHTAKGAEIAAPIAGRLGLDQEGIDLVVFLIRNHILMADLATTRDLSEERVIVGFARKMRDPQRLSMLYLLTIADSKATGPLGWNEWKEALIGELFAKALHIMEKGLLRDPANAQRLEKKWQQLVGEIPEEQGTKQAGRLWSLPQSYILHTDIAVIKRHLSLRNELTLPDDIRVDISESENHGTLSIITKDRPGLFSLLTGILALNHIEVISAKVFTWLDGIAVDVFRVIPPWQDYHEWDRVARQFKKAVSGNMDISAKIARMKGLKNPAHTMLPTRQKPSVYLDNETSDFFTLIEVRAPNRLGILFHVARVISFSGLDIHRAFLSRSGDLRCDVFYVVDSLGEKIADEERKASLEKEMYKVISGSDPADTEYTGKDNGIHDKEQDMPMSGREQG